MSNKKSVRISAPNLTIKTSNAAALSHNKMKYTSLSEMKTPNPSTLDELAQCSICLDTMSTPKMLPCQHTFCLQCLKDIANKELQSSSSTKTPALKKIICPLCKKEMPLEKGFDSLETLPNNIYIETLLAFISNSGKASPTSSPGKLERNCTYCQKGLQLSDESCQHCKQYFCSDCYTAHADKLIEKLPNLLKQLDEGKTKLEYKKEGFLNRNESLKASIRTATEARLLDLKAKEEALLEEVQKDREDELESLDFIKNRISKFKDDASNVDVGSIRRGGEKINIYLEFCKANSKISDLIAKWGENSMIFDGNAFKLEKNHMELNLVELCDDSKDLELDNEENLENFYKNHSFSPKFVWNKCPRPTGVGIPPWCDHHLYISASETKFVLILDRNTNKVIGRLTHQDMLCPNGLAFCKEKKETFVTDKWRHCIHVFSENGEFSRSICSRGVTEGKLISPEGIALGTKGELLVCDTGNNRVLVLDPLDGRQINVIGINKRKTEFDVPTSVAYFNEKIYVADCGSNRIKIFGLQGEKVLEFGSMGKNKGEFRSPEVVVVDSMGYILVGDSGNGRIQVFTSSGEFVKTLGKPGDGAGRFRWISGLFISDQMEIVVSDHKNKSVQIF